MSNFANIPAEYSSYADSAIVILPVPFDQTSTWIKGADRGPAALIEASANMELYDMETDSEVYRHGIFTDPIPEGLWSPEEMVASVRRTVVGHLNAGKFVVTIGGEHSVSIGAFGAHLEKYPKATVLQLDAHADLRDEYEGSKFNHACVMARAEEMADTVSVGIRSAESPVTKLIEAGRLFPAEDIWDNRDWFEAAMVKISEDVYVTIDLDVFDPSIMPSTGTPEPGGLGWYMVLGFLKMVTEKKNLLGFDVVELCPNETNKGPDFLAAKLVYKLLSYKFKGQR